MKKTQAKPKAQNAKSKWFAAIAVTILLVVAAGAAWRFTHPPQDPQVAEVQALQRQLFQVAAGDPRGERSSTASNPAANTSGPAAETPAAQPLTDAQRSELFEQLRTKMESLTDDQRRQVMEGGRDMFRARMRETIEGYHALPADEKVAYLDKEIDRWEERRARSDAARRQREAEGGAVAAGAGNSGNRGGPGGFRDMSEEDRQQWRRDMLGDTTPKERAEFAEYMDAINKCREERGLESFGPFGR